MLDLLQIRNSIPAMTEMAINNVRQLETHILNVPQTNIATDHLFHAGVYARTIMVPAGVILTGALIKIATVLIVNGACIIYIGDEAKELHGYNVFAANSGRKQAFVAVTDTHLTMIFATEARTIENAENEFTDEPDRLFSRALSAVNHLTVTEQ